MNPERWADITRSFGLTGIDATEATPPSEQLQPCKTKHVAQTKESGLSYANYHKVVQTNANGGCVGVDTIRQESPLDIHPFSNGESTATQYGNSINADDVPSKVIENLCKIVREKSEKIKLQEQVIHSLNERLQSKSLKGSSVIQKVEKDATDSDGESKKEVKETDSSSDTESISLRKILLKIENLERRLDTVINFIQRKYPKDMAAIPNPFTGKKKRPGESILFSRTWDKPPTVYPKPTYGSLMREIHCRHRFINVNGGGANASSDTEVVRESGGAGGVRRQFSTNPKMFREEDDNAFEMRIQALERLVILLKGKLMKKINSRRK